MRFVFTLLMIALPVLVAQRPGPATASNVVRLTTVTPEYCAALSERLASLPRATEDGPRAMAEEGRRLCAEGQVRIGIAWLRRAIRAASGAD
jgi:hypothetical protein